MTTKVLNLYAGIGGNRKEWEDVDVTAVEWDSDKAEIYRDHFPNDTVIEADAHEYLKDHFREYDFIWASPPCPTHSKIRKLGTGEDEQNDPVYPDMKLYQEILFLQGYFDGDWVVENVNSWYDPFIEPNEVGRHYLWSNVHISPIDLPSQNNQYGDFEHWEKLYGFDLSGYDLPYNKRQKMLRNCVHPELGKHAFESTRSKRQTTLM
jgi:DNA (cytosine-5)-methyltransferase 1